MQSCLLISAAGCDGGRGTIIIEPIETQHKPAGELTAVSCNSGWGFGAVARYSWRYNRGSWTWTQTFTPNKEGDIFMGRQQTERREIGRTTR